MDEHKLADAFRDAVRDTPPASFDAKDVVAASHRITVRRRMTLAGGSALGVVVLAGGVVLGTSTFGGGGDQQHPAAAGHTTAQIQIYSAPAESSRQRLNVSPGSTSRPGASSQQGSGDSGTAGPMAGNTPQGCGPVDRELAAALADELPVTAGTPPAPVGGSCPAGSRAVAVPVRDGDAVGTVAVVLIPAADGQQLSLNGGTSAAATAHGGAKLTVLSVPNPGSESAPFVARLPQLANQLATRF